MPSPRSIVIGQVTSLTGSNYMGLENRDGAALAVQQLNDAGGVLGRPVELAVEDDESLPQGAVAGYHRLADRGVVAVVGTSFSNASLAVLPHTDERQVVYVSTGAAHTQVDPVRPYVFMTPPTGQLVAALTKPFERRHDVPPSQFAVDGYTAVRLIAGAVAAAGDDDPQAVRQAMDSLTCLTPEGEYHFSSTDHSGLDVNDVAVAVIRDGRFRLTPWSRDELLRHLT